MASTMDGNPWQERYATMTFNRNYAVVPQSPNVGAQIAPIPINSQASNSRILPYSFPCPLASEQVVINPAISVAGGTQYPLVLSVPGKSLVEGQLFTWLISGALIQPGTTPTVGFTLYSGNSMTVGNNTVLKALAAQSVAGGLVPFWIESWLVADSTSGKMYGSVRAMIGANFVADAAYTNPVANVNFANDPVLQFLFSVTPTVANAGNICKIYENAVNFA